MSSEYPSSPSNLNIPRGVQAVCMTMVERSASQPNPRSPEALAARLRALRKSVADSQADLCRRLGIATNTWNQYERMKGSPDLAHALKIAETLGVTLDWIYFGDPSGLPHWLAIEIGKRLDEPMADEPRGPRRREPRVGTGALPSGDGEPQQREPTRRRR